MKFSDFLNEHKIFENGYRNQYPLASVVMPTYARNAEGLLNNCIESVLNQTFQNFEFIIVDDGSTDGSEAVIRHYAQSDPRIVYVRHDINSGLPAVRTNEAILLARAPYIGFIFDDNLWYPDTLEAMIKSINFFKADMAYGPILMEQEGQNILLGGSPASMEILRVLNTIANGGVICHKDFFNKTGLYDPHLVLRRVCDWDLWVRALRQGVKICQINQTLGVEKGLLSPTSLGNSVKFDFKVVLSYMFDSDLTGKRTEDLHPDRIMDYEVFNPETIMPYLCNWAEWEQLKELVYQPFFETHPYYGYELPLLHNRRFDRKITGYHLNATLPIFKNRKRVLFIVNRFDRIVEDWVEALEKDGNHIVLVINEMSRVYFYPDDIDIVILIDSVNQEALPFLQRCREKGNPIIFIVIHGLDSPEIKEGDPLTALDLMKNKSLHEQFRGLVYFGMPGVPWPEEFQSGAKALMEFSDQVVLMAQIAPCGLLEDLSFLQLDFIPNQLTERIDCYKPLNRAMFLADASLLEEPTIGTVIDLLTRTPEGVKWRIYLLPGGGLPGTLQDFSNQMEVIFLLESLPSLVKKSKGVAWALPPEIINRYSEYHRFLLEEDLARNQSIGIKLENGKVPEDISDDTLYGLIDEHQKLLLNRFAGFRSDARCLHLTNIVKGTTLRQKITKIQNQKRAVDIKSLTFINSQAFAGSEAYGLLVTKALTNIGFKIKACTHKSYDLYPEGIKNLNDWLSTHNLPPIHKVEYGKVCRDIFQTTVPVQEIKDYSDNLSEWLEEFKIGLVFCSGFISEPLIGRRQKRLVYMALFAPWDYYLQRMGYLRDHVAGWVSDTQWAANLWSRWMPPPFACVPSMVETINFKIRNLSLPMDPIRIALAGTIQPRKRQKEAVQAFLNLLQEGWNLHLNLYGYELSGFGKYINELKEMAENSMFRNRITFNGFIDDPQEIPQNNHIILNSSTDESLPQGVIFNMAAGLIAVATPAGGASEMIIDEETGFLAKGFNTEALTNALRRAIQARAKWLDIISKAQRLIIERCSEQIFTSRLMDVMLRGADIRFSPGYNYFSDLRSSVVSGPFVKKSEPAPIHRSVDFPLQNLPIGPKIGSRELHFSLLAEGDRLTGLTFPMSTLSTEPQGKFFLKIAAHNHGYGEVLRQVEIDLAGMRDKEWVRTEFEPILNSKNRRFYLIARADVTSGKIAFYENRPSAKRKYGEYWRLAEDWIDRGLGGGGKCSVQAIFPIYLE